MTKKVKPDEAKQRMRQYLRERNINLIQAEMTCGYKRGYLSAGGVVGSDKLASFLEAYPDCDLYYIVTGSHDGDPRIRRAQALLSECAEHISDTQKNMKALTALVTDMVTKK